MSSRHQHLPKIGRKCEFLPYAQTCHDLQHQALRIGEDDHWLRESEAAKGEGRCLEDALQLWLLIRAVFCCLAQFVAWLLRLA